MATYNVNLTFVHFANVYVSWAENKHPQELHTIDHYPNAGRPGDGGVAPAIWYASGESCDGVQWGHIGKRNPDINLHFTELSMLLEGESWYGNRLLAQLYVMGLSASQVLADYLTKLLNHAFEQIRATQGDFTAASKIVLGLPAARDWSDDGYKLLQDSVREAFRRLGRECERMILTTRHQGVSEH